ncbi:EAL domain-containing protein [Thermanaerosceptrum fracticalcis]|uniref:EAL domain-containing protein n=1 Tax=Thermanaerosceptrum fracticalcis TaxID=1712410 RepID=A0A7G6E716_THEFR|nr:EAL domain-containing protein [Thermanaerosceptrum fracticalcis]QNB47870.1 EAL domain-containing protein [Thermanaerosceptrum fracticalcis]
MLEQLKNERTEMENELKKLIIKDSLTGLYNKAFFIEQLDRFIQKSDREKDRFGLLFIDFNKFKEINDTLGHHTGDRVIFEAARRLESAVSENCLLARYGGDEFVMLVCDVHSRAELYNIAKEILQSFDSACYIDGHEFYLSASIGIALYPFDGRDSDNLIKNADIAMYKAKEDKDEEYNIRFFTSEMEKEVQERFMIETQLRKALENQELSLCFQPIVEISKNKLEGAEALLRWKNVKLGFVPPEKFISIAEETGLIHSIGKYVLENVCNFIKSMERKGLPLIPVAVNISAKQLENRNFAETVKSIIEYYQIDTRYLEFEITESVSAGNMKRIKENIEKIKDLGIKLSMDDFGTGYSSFAMLLNLQIDKLKIDKMFIDNIGKMREEKIIRTILSMAKELGLKVVAEGIETEKQLKFLKDVSCDYGQGYLFNRPMDINMFEEYLKIRCYSKGKSPDNFSGSVC